jgi:hypothetical protein
MTMAAQEPAGHSVEPSEDLAPLAQEWARAITQAVYRPMSRQQTEELLADLLGRLRAALLNEPFSADPARSVGAALVDAGIHRPEALERSLVFLDEHLLVELGLDDYTYRPLMTRLLAGLAGGWASVLKGQAVRSQREEGRPATRRSSGGAGRLGA